MTTGYELRVDRDISAAPTRIYDAFLGIYDEPLPEWVLESHRDLRVGGAWDITFRPQGLEAFSEHRIFTIVDRPCTLEYIATIAAANAQPYNTAVSFRVEQTGATSHVSLTQSGFPNADLRDEFAVAWRYVLDMVAARAN